MADESKKLEYKKSHYVVDKVGDSSSPAEEFFQPDQNELLEIISTFERLQFVLNFDEDSGEDNDESKADLLKKQKQRSVGQCNAFAWMGLIGMAVADKAEEINDSVFNLQSIKEKAHILNKWSTSSPSGEEDRSLSMTRIMLKTAFPDTDVRTLPGESVKDAVEFFKFYFDRFHVPSFEKAQVIAGEGTEFPLKEDEKERAAVETLSALPFVADTPEKLAECLARVIAPGRMIIVADTGAYLATDKISLKSGGGHTCAIYLTKAGDKCFYIDSNHPDWLRTSLQLPKDGSAASRMPEVYLKLAESLFGSFFSTKQPNAGVLLDVSVSKLATSKELSAIASEKATLEEQTDKLLDVKRIGVEKQSTLYAFGAADLQHKVFSPLVKSGEVAIDTVTLPDDRKDENDRTLLRYAALRANVQNILLLIQYGAKNDSGQYEEAYDFAIETAQEAKEAKNKSKETRYTQTAELLKLGKSLRSRSPKERLQELLYGAIEKGKLDLVEIILKQGADINGFYNDETPLLYAVRYGQVEIVTWLLKQGTINPNIKDTLFNEPPLMSAIGSAKAKSGADREKYIQIIGQLLSNPKTEIGLEDGLGKKPKDLLASDAKLEEKVKEVWKSAKVARKAASSVEKQIEGISVVTSTSSVSSPPPPPPI